MTAGVSKTQIPQKSLRVTYRVHKAELLSWNGTWAETVASRMGRNVHWIETPQAKFVPFGPPWERPCFNSGTVSTQGLYLVQCIVNRKPHRDHGELSWPHRFVLPIFPSSVRAFSQRTAQKRKKYIAAQKSMCYPHQQQSRESPWKTHECFSLPFASYTISPFSDSFPSTVSP